MIQKKEHGKVVLMSHALMRRVSPVLAFWLFGVCVAPAASAEQESLVVNMPLRTTSHIHDSVESAPLLDENIPGLATEVKDSNLKQAASVARQRYGGDVVKAEEISRNGEDLYQIRLINNGRVRDVLVNADDWTIVTPK